MDAGNFEKIDIKHAGKKDDHDELDLNHHEEAGEPWLMSYADMMTLLFCFFVIMTAFANFDPAQVAKLSKEVANYTSNGEIDKEEKKLNDLNNDVASRPELQGVAASKVQEGAMELIFSTTVLYPSEGGQAAIEGFYKNIDVLVGLIKNKSSDYRIIIEGHTDINDSETLSDGTQLNSWELSANRASRVVSRFIFNGFNAGQLVSVGYGDSRPVAESFDKKGREIEENRSLNRRVVIKVLQPLKGKKIKNMKIENYFENEEILDKN